MRVLVTGASGFVGTHLVCYAATREVGIEIFACSRRGPSSAWPGSVRSLRVELLDGGSIRRAVATARPDVVFHLAAQSSVKASWSDPGTTLQTNILGQTVLLEALREECLDPVVLVVGSSEEYGRVAPDEIPIRECNPLRPESPYAVSKANQDLQGALAWQTHGQRVVRARAFNHTGPGHGERFVVPSFALQLARIEAGLVEPRLQVGNLDATRDFTDVRDMVVAYWLLAERGEPGEVYNVASGVGVTIGGLLDRLLGMIEGDVEVEADPERARPTDLPILVGDSTRLRQRTGWSPRIPIATTLRDILEEARLRVVHGRETV